MTMPMSTHLVKDYHVPAATLAKLVPGSIVIIRATSDSLRLRAKVIEINRTAGKVVSIRFVTDTDSLARFARVDQIERVYKL